MQASDQDNQNMVFEQVDYQKANADETSASRASNEKKSPVDQIKINKADGQAYINVQSTERSSQPSIMEQTQNQTITMTGEYEEEIKERSSPMNADQHVVTQASDVTDSSIDLAGHNSFASVNMKSRLPVLKINLPLQFTTNSIFELFSYVSRKTSFQVIEMEQTIATAVNKEPFSMRQMFLKCLPMSSNRRDSLQGGQPSPISAVRLQISVNDTKACRKITLKGLYGQKELLKNFINTFKTQIHEQVANLSLNNKMNSGANSSRVLKKNSNRGKNQHTQFEDEDEEDEDSKISAFNEISSVYQIHKILSSNQYTVGKNMQEYIECFQLQYKSLQDSADLLPQPMEGILTIVEETVNSFNSQYNMGKDSGKEMLVYARPAVEKYIFNKLYDKLFAMYAFKFESKDKLFLDRGNQIKNITPNEQIKYLGLSKKFQIGGSTPSSGSSTGGTASLSSTSQSKSLLNVSDEAQSERQPNSSEDRSNPQAKFNLALQQAASRGDVPYIDAIRSIEKIQQHLSPRDKIVCLSEAFGSLKSTVVDQHKGKFELQAMDDVLPLFIYIVAQAQIGHAWSENQLMEDYLRINQRGFELERKLLTNFDASIRYITSEWEINDTKN